MGVLINMSGLFCNVKILSVLTTKYCSYTLGQHHSLLERSFASVRFWLNTFDDTYSINSTHKLADLYIDMP